MPAPRPLPDGLHGRVFTRVEALEAGLTPRMLEGRRIVRVHAGVYRYADTPMTFALAIDAARRVLPPDAALSHVSNVRWRGLEIGSVLPLHFSTNSGAYVERPGIVLHRRQGRLHPRDLHGVPSLGADRTFVDISTQLALGRVVAVGDWLVATGQTDLIDLRGYVLESHLDGVQRARTAARLVREGSASVRESQVRWIAVGAGLPEPELNTDIRSERGRFLARGDLVYRRWKVLVEYDGWQHERDADQRQRDHLRREALEAEGWRVIVVTVADLRHPESVAHRIHQALAQRGYGGPAPRFAA